jgi:hypothetical protein
MGRTEPLVQSAPSVLAAILALHLLFISQGLNRRNLLARPTFGIVDATDFP